jgi:hypothetical protein
MIYAGQEWENAVRPSLFEKEPISRNTSKDLSPLLQTLYRIKKDPAFTDSSYKVTVAGPVSGGASDVLVGIHRAKAGSAAVMVGVFGFKGWTGPVDLAAALQQSVPDGAYTNMIDGACFRIEGGRVSLRGEPVIFKVGADLL